MTAPFRPHREHSTTTNPTWIFFLVLCIILFAPVLNKLKIPHLIGMILAGIPTVSMDSISVKTAALLELFGQVGLTTSCS